MLIAQISDMHVRAPDSKSFAGIDTAANLARAVAHLATLEPAPDVILATGDLVSDGRPAEYAILRGLLAPLGPPVYLIPGNHDIREEMLAAFPDHGYLPREGTFLHYVIERYPVRLLALDTVVPGELGGEVCAERLAWLDARLGEAAERPTVIFMHHPPFACGLAPFDATRCRGGAAMGAIVARHPHVERVLCGHIHRPVETRWHGTMASVCPSTALQLDLDLRADGVFTWSDEPIQCQLHLWRPGAGLVTHTLLIGAPAAAA